MVSKLRKKLRDDLESPADRRRLGSGWISGVAALLASITAFALVLCLRFPGTLTVPQLHTVYDKIPFRLLLHFLLIFSYAMALISLVLRHSKVTATIAVCITLIATIIGSSTSSSQGELFSGMFLGLDWFILNVLFTGFLFVPLERFLPRNTEQGLFRSDWREDLFYYFISSMLVQIFTYLSLWPSQEITTHTHWEAVRAVMGGQPFGLQLVEIMMLTDLVQYWVHRAFHKLPMLWQFHAVHHSARVMDWMAGARMHFLEILVLRGLTVIPMQILGFHQGPIQLYILIVYIYSTFIHANVHGSPRWLRNVFVTPQFHHWHHGLEKEAIDVNFAIHFPLLDRLFGTFHLPGERWPEGYGVGGHPVPPGYWQQLMYPFRRRLKTSQGPTSEVK